MPTTSAQSYPAATASTVSYTANNLDQYSAVGSVTPTYGGNGNLTFDGIFTYGYDAENRLISASGAGNTAAYAYDAQGRRKLKTVNGTTTIFVQDPQGRALLDYDGASGAIQNWYAFGSGPNDVLNQINLAGSTRATTIPDIQGSIVASLDASSGTLTKTGYQTWGESSFTSGTFRYTGARIDAETNGLYDFRARIYSPALGRFMQADPIGYSGGINLYAYVNNDPLNNIDPNGLYTLQLVVAVGGTFLGIAVPQAGFGIAIDTSGNVGSYKYVGGGVGIGVTAGAGGSVQVSNAQTIYDLSGPFANVSLNGGSGLGGSVDYFTGSSNNGPVFGGGVTFGTSTGGAVSATRTSTQICGSAGCVGNASDLLDVLSFAVTPAAAATLGQPQSSSNVNGSSSSTSPISSAGTPIEAPISSK